MNYIVSGEVLQLMVDALKIALSGRDITPAHDKADRAIRMIIASPPAEPVAWYDPDYELADEAVLDYEYETHCVPLYRKDL